MQVLRSALTLTAITVICSNAGAETIGQYAVTGPFVHANLTVFALRGPDTTPQDVATLDEALSAKTFKVRETGNVNQLVAQNNGKKPVYLQGGEIVKGGRQDRVIEHDTLIEPGTSVNLKVYCVEAGRWQPRGHESSTQFDSSTKQLVGKAALAPRMEKDQGKVWASVAKKQADLSVSAGKPVQNAASPTSMQLALEDRDVEKAINAYAKAFESVPGSQNDIIGFAYAVNGRPEAIEILPSHALLAKQWKKLIDGAATEAFAVKNEALSTQPLTVAAFAELLGDTDTAKEEIEQAGPNVQVKKKETTKSVLIETNASGNNRKSYTRK